MSLEGAPGAQRAVFRGDRSPDVTVTTTRDPRGTTLTFDAEPGGGREGGDLAVTTLTNSNPKSSFPGLVHAINGDQADIYCEAAFNGGRGAAQATLQEMAPGQDAVPENDRALAVDGASASVRVAIEQNGEVCTILSEPPPAEQAPETPRRISNGLTG